MHLLDLKKAGAIDAILENAESSLQLRSKFLKGLGVMSDDVSFRSRLVRDSMELQVQDALERTDDPKVNVMKPLQVRVVDSLVAPPCSNEDEPRRIKRSNEDIKLDSPTTTNPSYSSELDLSDVGAKGVLDAENDTQYHVDGVYMKNPVGVTSEDTWWFLRHV